MNLRSGLSLFSKNPRASRRVSYHNKNSFPSATTTAAALWCLVSTCSYTTTIFLRTSSQHNHFFAVSAMATITTTTATTTKDPRFRTWPITSTKSLEPMLKEMGLEVPAEQIDGTSSGNTASGALSDALVSVGTAGRGGTGSFVSKRGLIVTNWHVAYDAVRRASIDANDENTDYIRDGFVARSLEEEIEGPNYECWITEACLDVSDKVLESVINVADSDPLERANKIRDVRQELAQDAQEKEGGGDDVRCDVVEMVPGKSYVLFTYKRLRDVRIVYVPPKSLGNFGGDTDNFEWPRHTADFTLLRAYVPPPSGEQQQKKGSWDGYHPDNVPYDSSRSFIKVRKPSEETDIKEDDMVFLLGFPGSTMRYAPTPRLKYADEVAVPHTVQDFAKKLQLIAKHEGHSSEAALKLGSTKKGLANNLKRNRGKLVMMRKLKLMEERLAEEAKLVENDATTKTKDGEKSSSVKDILARLGEIYDTFQKDHAVSSALETLRGVYGGSSLLAAGHSIHEYLAEEQKKPDAERESGYRKRNLPFLVNRLTKRLRDIHLPHEADLVRDCVASVEQLKKSAGGGDDDDDEVLKKCLASLGETILKDGETAENAVVGDTASSKLLLMATDPSVDLLSDIFVDAAETTWLADPFVLVAAALYELYKRDRDTTKALLSERDTLLAKLLEFQQRADGDGESIFPDCNGSLRISAGFMEKYQASDAVVHTPLTTLAGLLDKATEARMMATDTDEYGDSEFRCPDRLYEMLQDGTTGAAAQKVPMCILYSTDTVGGNSGSPVMNKRGELVAINFDRQRLGLMNEYKWSSKYSRSIGVDVRLILWLVGEYDGATHLIDELICAE